MLIEGRRNIEIGYFKNGFLFLMFLGVFVG